MENELDPNIIKTTQLTLGKYVKRPPLSEKLLKKPPFRFLHDVITSVLNTTGFFRNLFDDVELVSDNVKDRDSKIAFLNKVIFVISSTTGKTLTAKSSKIVAGQEPEKTNELLQCLAQALDEKLSSDIAVNKFKQSFQSNEVTETKVKESGNKTVKKVNDSKKLASKSNEKLTNQKNDSSRTSNKQDKNKAIGDAKSKKKENETTKIDNQSISKKNAQPKIEKAKRVIHGQAKTEHDLESNDGTKSRLIENKEQNKLSKEKSQSNDENNHELLANHEEATKTEQELENLNSSYTIAEADLNSSSSTNNIIENESGNAEDIQVEDSTIKKPPNRQPFDNDESDRYHKPERVVNSQKSDVKQDFVKQTDKEIQNFKDTVKSVTSPESDSNSLRPQSVRPSSSRPGAPRMRDKIDNVIKDSDNLLLGKVNIIVENIQHEEEEDNLIIIDSQQEGSITSSTDQQILPTSNEHGHLVQQILDSQKELTQTTGKTEIEWQFGMQKARESINQEVEQVRFNVQALSRVTNPLRKLLDHIQEDVEVMRQEHQQWSSINEEVSKEIIKQNSLNEDTLTPYHTKIKQLERDIEDKREKNNDLKIMIQKNAIRIKKLLANGSVQ